MKSKLTSLPNHTKILVGGPWRKVIIDIPESLSVGTPIRLMNSSIVNSMIEIFAKRYHELYLALKCEAIFLLMQGLRKGKNRSSSEAKDM